MRETRRRSTRARSWCTTRRVADPAYAFALSRLSGSDLRYTPIGVFRSVDRPTYDGLMAAQLDQARAAAEPDLAALLAGNDTWTVY